MCIILYSEEAHFQDAYFKACHATSPGGSELYENYIILLYQYIVNIFSTKTPAKQLIKLLYE